MEELKNKVENMIFFDNASTTSVDDRVFSEMIPYFTQYYGNPSSFHYVGQEVNNKMDEARLKVAELVGAGTEEIYFTSSGSESNNFAVWGIARANKDMGNHIIVSEIEHFSVLNPVKEMKREGWDFTIIPVDEYGLVNPQDIKQAINKKT